MFDMHVLMAILEQPPEANILVGVRSAYYHRLRTEEDGLQKSYPQDRDFNFAQA
jgi:hypothetical protein